MKPASINSPHCPVKTGTLPHVNTYSSAEYCLGGFAAACTRLVNALGGIDPVFVRAKTPTVNMFAGGKKWRLIWQLKPRNPRCPLVSQKVQSAQRASYYMESKWTITTGTKTLHCSTWNFYYLYTTMGWKCVNIHKWKGYSHNKICCKKLTLPRVFFLAYI